MPSAEVGALRARLDLDNAGFVEGLAKSQATLNGFAQRFNSLSGLITGYAQRMAGALSIAFAAHQIKAALEYADAMGKLAQSAGTTTEEFSALAFAASLSDVSVEELSASLARFNRNIAEATTQSTGAGFALQTMGINIRNSQGGLRNAVDLLGDVADKFAGYADGANKAAIAQELFGRAGARLIPLLNQGRAGLEALKEEARRLGIIVSDDTAKKAEEFNDALTKLGSAARGAMVDLGALVAGPLTAFANTILSIQSHFRNRNVLTAILGDNASRQEYEAQLKTLNEQLKQAVATQERESRSPIVKPERLAYLAEIVRLKQAEIDKTKEQMALAATHRWEDVTETEKGDAPNTKEAEAEAERRVAQAASEAKLAIEEAQQAAADYGAILAELNTPLDTYRQKMLDIAVAQRLWGADTAKLAQAQAKAAAQMHAAWAGAASAMTGALTELFNKNKAVAIANALVSTYEAVAKAQAAYVPPLSYAFMAAALVRGMAQVQAIRSTSATGGGGGAAAGGGAGASPGTTAAAPPAAERDQHSLHISGIDPARLYSGEAVRHLVSGINEYVRDGGYMVATKVQP